MATVRIVLEFETTTKRIDRALAHYAWGPTPEAEQDDFLISLSNEILIAEVLDANPGLARQAILNRILGGKIHHLENFDLKGLTPAEALDHGFTSLIPLVLAQAPEKYRAQLERYCQVAGFLDGSSNISCLAEEGMGLDLTRVLVEDEQGVLATSDERKRRYKKKKK